MHRFVFLLAISGNNYLCSCHNKVCWFVWEMKCKQILIYLFIYCCWQSLSWYCLISAEKCLWNIIQQYYIIYIDHSSCATTTGLNKRCHRNMKAKQDKPLEKSSTVLPVMIAKLLSLDAQNKGSENTTKHFLPVKTRLVLHLFILKAMLHLLCGMQKRRLFSSAEKRKFSLCSPWIPS